MKEIRINENIRTLRKKMGIGQEALADNLGVTVQAVSKWETGGSMPDITLIPRIAAFFGVTMEELYFTDLSASPETPIAPEEVTIADIDPWTTPQNHEEETNQQQPEEDIPHFDGRDNRWADWENIGRSISDNISDQMKKIGGNLKEMFSHSDRWANENRVREDLPDDGVLRVAQFIGNKMVAVNEVKGDTVIRLALDPHSPIRKMTVYGSVIVDGNVGGSVIADEDVHCATVGGSVTADGNVEIKGSVGGNVTADNNVHCEGNIGGSVTADNNVTCQNIQGSVVADGNVYCNTVQGKVRKS